MRLGHGRPTRDMVNGEMRAAGCRPGAESPLEIGGANEAADHG
jgi:hypothetical protein